MPIKTILLFGLLSLGLNTFAQNKEANPNIDTEWRFVKSQELVMLSGSFYSFEFPAEKGYDYIFNLAHNMNGVFASMVVFDMQDQLIQKITINESSLSLDLNFEVKASGTYKVVLGLTDPDTNKGNPMPSQFSLIRRIQF